MCCCCCSRSKKRVYTCRQPGQATECAFHERACSPPRGKGCIFLWWAQMIIFSCHLLAVEDVLQSHSIESVYRCKNEKRAFALIGGRRRQVEDNPDYIASARTTCATRVAGAACQTPCRTGPATTTTSSSTVLFSRKTT